MARWYFGGKLFGMSPVFKGDRIWKNEFLLWSVLVYHVRMIKTLSSVGQTYYIVIASYCARQAPRIMKHGPCFHGTGSIIVGTRECAVSVWT